MAIKIYKDSSDWVRLQSEIQDSVSETISFDNICVILMIRIVGNVQKKNRPIQRNVADIKDFFPVPQRSVFSDKWRYKFKTFQGVSTEGYTVLRPSLQNSYEYVQITFEGDIQEYKRKLNEDDKLILFKRTNTDTYELIGIKANESKFSEESDFVAFNFSKFDETFFTAPEILPIEEFTQREFVRMDVPKQKIYFGSPGTGKSTALQNFVVEHGLEVVRTTFHPDTDYYSFVGGYKPVMKGDAIVYQFVPQAFMKAYVKAYQNPDRSYLLAIEEINRGNCAQIFGDLFQCLDRNSEGFSCYPIEANTDLVSYLTSEGLANPEQIILPPNLLIYATMNTSDQSLFPMDAAFKRRWDWEYVPIQFDEKAAAFKILFDTENQYAWRSFVETVNKRITEITKSEDKKIGVYFVVPTNGIISLEQFKNKVMFYLWSEIFKDEHSSEDSIFKYLDEDGNALDFTFNELFESDGLAKLKGFMNYLEIALV